MAIWDRIVTAILQLNIGYLDIIDIIIVSYVFYRLILLIRGTRAAVSYTHLGLQRLLL